MQASITEIRLEIKGENLVNEFLEEKMKEKTHKCGLNPMTFRSKAAFSRPVIQIMGFVFSLTN